MITTDIKKGLEIIKDSLQWANTYGKDSFPRDVFKNYRRQIKTIAEALSENCSAAAYGESQVGKSYLISSLLSSPDAPFVIENNGKKYSFIDEINPSGGNTNKTESTGVITRFTIRHTNDGMNGFVKVKNLSVVDIILLITDSYYNDIRINPDSVMKYEDINRSLAEMSDSWGTAKVQSHITEDDVKDICDYVHDIIGNNASNVYQSNFCKIVAPAIERIPYEKWVDVFGLLWNCNPELNKLFSTLISEYSQLNFTTDIYVPFDAVIRSKGTLLKIEWLDSVCGIHHEMKEGEVDYTDIYGSDGKLIKGHFSKGSLSALIGEITFTLPEAIAKDRRFLQKIDLLDFPGARSREKIKEDKIKGVLPTILRRGKVAYLFNKYSRSKKISAVLFCHHNDQKAEATLGSSINSWIESEIGKTPEERAVELNRTNGISPLFLICTKFNIDLEKTKNDSRESGLDGHWSRFKTVIPEIIKPEKWLEDWVPQAGRFASRNFQNIFLLRDFYWSGKNSVFDGYNEKNHSIESSVHQFPEYPEYFDDLRLSFLDNPFVKAHFASPAQAWDDVATVNNDGSKAIIRNLDSIAEVLDDARHQRYLGRLAEIRKDIVNRLNVYHESEDKEANNRKVRQISGDIKFQLAALIGTKPEAFGQIIDSLMVKSSTVRSIVYDIIVRHIDEPKDVSIIKLVRAECGIDTNNTREVNVRKLCRKYSKSEQELEKLFKEKNLSISEIIEDDSEIPATIADVIAKHIIDYWNDHINEQVKALESVLPHADEVAFMLMALLSRLGVKKELSNKINDYYKLFNESALPTAISDYASLSLNNFVSTIGRDYMTDADIKVIAEKAKACDLDIDLSPDGSKPVRESRPLLEVLTALDESGDLINQDVIDMNTLRKLPFWDNYQRWENLVTIGLLYSSDISHVDPVANAAVKEIMGRCTPLFNN